MGDPTSYEKFIANASALATRSEWFVELYLKNPSGAEVIVRLSLRGTPTGLEDIVVGTDTLPANTRYPRRIVEPPSITQSLWKPGSIFGSSFPSYGRMILNNRDGGLDQYKPSNGYQWKDCLIKVFFADLLHPAETINKEFEALLGDPEYSLSDVSVPIRGLESQFEQSTSERVYRGSLWCLELTGDRTISYGTPSAVNITGALTVSGWLWYEALPAASRRVWGWHGGALSPWSVYSILGGTLALAGFISGAEQIKTTTKVLSTFRWYHFTFTVSAAGAVTYYLWDADAQELTTETLTSFTSGTRQGNSGGTYVVRSASDATLKFWCDEMRVSNVALTASQIQADRHRPIAAGSVPASMVHYVPFEDGSGTTVVDRSATAANGTISGAGSSTWLPALEGGPELAGVAKPDIWGGPIPVDPILVAPVQYIYQVAGAGSIQAITSEEGGLAHTMDATAANLRTFLTTVPISGHSGQYLARGYFRLSTSSVPTLPVTATVQGYNDGPLGYVNKPVTIIRDVITRRGPKLADPGDLATATFTSAQSAFNPTVGFYLKTPMQIMGFLDKIARSGADVWGYRGSSVLFRIDHFEGPKVTADHNFTGRHIVLNSFKDQSPIQVIYKVIIKYLERPKTLAENEVSATVKGTANWMQWTQQWQEQPATDEDILADYDSLGPPLVIETGIVTQEDAKTLAEYVLSIVKGPKAAAMVSIIAAGRQVVIGDTETVKLTLQGGEVRLGVDGEKEYLVLSTELSGFRAEARHEIWGAIDA